MKKGGDPGGSNSIVNINTSNNNKRKIDDAADGLPVPKHACLDNSPQIQDTTTCVHSAMSLSNEDDNDLCSSSSVNWSGTQDSTHFDYPSPHLDDCGEDMIPADYYQSQNHVVEEEASSTNYVLSSGRWDVAADTEQITEKLTIDKEFEQYFSMLML